MFRGTPLGRRGAADGFAVTVAPGCASIACPDDSLFAAALAAARNATVVVAAFGLDGSQEGEGHDRKTLGLPGRQEDLLNALRETGTPVILLLAHGGPIALAVAADAAAWPAVLTIWYPGQAGGAAAVPLLFGDTSPSGRTMVSWLPQTWADAREVIDMELQAHGAVPGATYRWFEGAPLFEFGSGLSYTTFAYSWADAAPPAAPPALDVAALADGRAAPPAYRVNVTNTGSVVSDVSVLAFVSSGQPDEPLRELFDFGRLAALAPGETRQLIFSLDLRVLASGRRPRNGAADGAHAATLFLYPGAYTISIGDTPSSGNAVSAALTLTGSPAALRDDI
jgi:hypothetical protein